MGLRKRKQGSGGRQRKLSKRSERSTEYRRSERTKYAVIIQPSAAAQIEEAYLWIRERSPAGAAAWYERLSAAVESLGLNPWRCRLAPEAHAFEEEIRQLLCGKGKGVFRILFTVDGNEVHIVHVRRASRQHLTARASETDE